MIKSVIKTLQVLKLFTIKDVWSAQEIEEELDYHKSSVQRILSTLEAEGFIQRVNDDRSIFKLGTIIFILGRVAEDLDLREIAQPVLEDLTGKTHETSHLCVAEENECLYIAKIDSPNSIRMVTSIGKRLSLHNTGVGKVLLSGMPTEAVNRVIAQRGLEQSTPNTITDPNALFEELDCIRNQGYALDNEEREIGLKCVAAPVFNRKGQVIASISISGPTMRMTPEVMPEYIKYAKEAASAISTKLGYQPSLEMELS
jgi:DNA-binding IclR family transcriptional regulator